MKNKRIVITGLGCISPLGHTVKDTWAAVLAGKSGVSKIDTFDVSSIASKISASVKNFDAAAYFNPKDERKADKFIQYGVAAAVEAIADSGLADFKFDPKRVGVAVGSGIGGLPMIERSYDLLLKNGPRKISPFFIPATIINLLPGHIAMRYGFKGPNISVVTACTTGTHNIGLAARSICYGDADVMVCGGSEMATCLMGQLGFSIMRALSTRNDEPEKASRPFDRDRDGFVLGDGAAILVLESYEHAKARGAHIYAELSGFGMTADAYHMTTPATDGPAEAMKIALADAGLTVEAVQYINAHGTSTGIGDVNEVNAIKQTFGDYAKKVAISSTKSMTGHLIAAAGAIEAIFSVLAIRDNIAPPTINLDHPEDGCDLDFVPNVARKMQIDVAVSNSFGFGGTNGTLVFERFKD